MLVCPQCQFDNPNHNFFCQNCGESLTYDHCHECGEQVPFSEETCANCGAMTGITWWVIVTSANSSEEKTFFASSDYLDVGQRYRLQDPWTQSEEPLADRQIRVLDCQPLQKSVLKVLLEDQAELLDLDAPRSSEETVSPWLPKLAVPYILLKDFAPAVPELHEAWQEGQKEVILLEDRSEWPSLDRVVERENPPVLQRVYWFDEMAKLWQVLSEVGCCQSLLVNRNLRLDEDLALGLQQLVFDRPDSPPSLSDLAVLWSQFLPPDRDPSTLALQELLERLREGKIDSVTELRLQLHELGDERPGFQEEETTDLQEAIEQTSHFLTSERSLEEEPSATNSGDITLVRASETDARPTAVVPMQLRSLADAGCTDNGRARRYNEDCFGIMTEIYKQQNNRGQTIQGRGLYIVCDGMGGHAAGEVASALAVNTLQTYFESQTRETMPSEETIKQGILLANQTIYQVNQDKDSYGSGRMGTTLVLALVRDTKVAIAHVGDSRIYCVNRKWGLEQLTVDHEVGQRAIQGGIDPQIAYARPDAYQLTQALGPHDNSYVQPGIRIFEIQEDTLLLLCSDGLSDNELVENHWQTHLSPLLNTAANLEEGLHQLITLANHKNGHDNITAILVRIKVRPNMEPSLLC
jgi:protein phosphatase